LTLPQGRIQRGDLGVKTLDGHFLQFARVFEKNPKIPPKYCRPYFVKKFQNITLATPLSYPKCWTSLMNDPKINLLFLLLHRNVFTFFGAS